MATGPTGFDRHYVVRTGRSNCRIGVGLDTTRGAIEQFLVQLETRLAAGRVQWVQVARVDHNPANPVGHDLESEGVHVDVVLRDGRERTIHPRGSVRHRGLGTILDTAVTYFDHHVEYFLGVYRGDVDPHDPPPWP